MPMQSPAFEHEPFTGSLDSIRPDTVARRGECWPKPAPSPTMMAPMRSTLLLRLAGLGVVVGTLLLGSARDAGADIYTYVDQDGVLHFTNQAPTHGSKSASDPWKLYAKSKDGASNKPPGWVPRVFGGGGAERYTRYDELIREAAGYYQLPEAFVRAIIKVESDYDPTALSIAGAQGLMQLMP